ncbi:MAG: tRNA (adenosine(37)-N6)-threonylcarbamoyltransferase complex dimerization subunit type 1 TsaB [Microscillaceae bacterium]|nr:tRNA (adenosine(37)-N6)-threonylcarbamoyltransferase complex dimerization subunit type 1 TsaB [Microscillaceae bacterium]MDW8460103.1 tRNA (adenosine(37)-N6)-threonylcarbamoyltransferase complex dimerization subunit type 1 TsaB [Cytophagales bacterium]
MAKILSIETATSVCSVALTDEGKCITETNIFRDYNHASLLTPLIEQQLAWANWQFTDLDAIAVSQGPGSYTGLRIGVSTAKGLCFALHKPLIAIPTLKAMAWQALQNIPQKDFWVCPMIDARRMEVYCGIWDSQLNNILPTQALILQPNSFAEMLQTQKVFFIGDGVAKAKPLFAYSPQAFFDRHFAPTARAVGFLAQQAFDNQKFENLAYFEPLYLKNFLATKPKNK